MKTQEIELNFYQILDIGSDASTTQIRSAFRKKAKQFHPDTVETGRQAKRHDQQMRQLIDAYQTLSQPELRRDYDLTHNIDARRFNFNFREFLRNRVGDNKSLARLIFYELLHDRPAEAIVLYERYFDDELDSSVTRQSIRRRLSFYFSYSDYIDCLFLLADAYEKQYQYLKAGRFYRNIARLESHKPILGYFFDEVRDALKRIISLWEKNGRPQHIIRFVPSLLEIKSLYRDRVFFEKRIARSEQRFRARVDADKRVQRKGSAVSERADRLHQVHA